MGQFRPRVFNAKIEILAISAIVEDQAPGNGDPVGRLPPQSPAALSLHAHTHTLHTQTHHTYTDRTRERPDEPTHTYSDANSCAKCYPHTVRVTKRSTIYTKIVSNVRGLIISGKIWWRGYQQ